MRVYFTFRTKIFGLGITMRRNLLNWCNLVSISKKLMFYVVGVVRIFEKSRKKITYKLSQTLFVVFLRHFLFTKSQFCLQCVKQQYNVDNSELLEKTGLFISLLSLAQVILKKKWTQIRHSRFKYAINQNWLELSMYGRKKEGSSSSVHIVMSLMH